MCNFDLTCLIALWLNIYAVQGQEEQAKETFAAALEALGDTVDESTDVVQQGLKRWAQGGG
jgi:hypothetical protein